MHAGWISESLLSWWVGPCVAVILSLPAVAVGSSLSDGRQQRRARSTHTSTL